MNSALYEGAVEHARLDAVRHRFRNRLFLLYLDLDELPTVFRRRWLWSTRRPNLCWFRRKDYLGPADRPLDEAVRDRVEAELGRRPPGPVRVLTHLRTFGHVFNPVSFYVCHEQDGSFAALVAEITNTPWRERRAYVLDARAAERSGDVLRWRFRKDFHVSPFQDLDQEYVWTLAPVGERFEVGMTSLEGGRPVFRAGLACRRRPLTGRALASALVRHPLLTLRVHAAIYWQALRLFARRAPFFVHPRKRAAIPGA